MKRTFLLIVALLFISCSDKSEDQSYLDTENGEDAAIYSIIMQYDSDGMAIATPNPAKKGDVVTIIAMSKTYYAFKEWQTVSGGVTLSGTTSNPAIFTMPGNAVTIKALFDILPVPISISNFTKTYNGSAQYATVVYADGVTETEAGVLTVVYVDENNDVVAEPTNTGVYGIKITTAGGSGYFAIPEPVNVGVLTINKADPVSHWPTGLEAAAWQTLSTIMLTGYGTSTTAGEFKWTSDGSTSVGTVGTQQHNMTFTPFDIENYNVVYRNVAVKVKENLIDVVSIVSRSNFSVGTSTVNLSMFTMGKFQVTQEQWFAVMSESANNANPSYFASNPDEEEIQGKRPVEYVNWFEALEFCNILSEKEYLPPYYLITDINRDQGGRIINAVVTTTAGNGYRLPTEAQWEYACRAGSPAEVTANDTTAWYNTNSNGKTHEVGLKDPNAWGLYDMLGNVHEWCWDWHGILYPYPYPNGATDPTGVPSGSIRILRGCSFAEEEVNSTVRHGTDPANYGVNIGFRVIRQIPNFVDMVWIPSGNFTMGSPASETDSFPDEHPQRMVTLTQGFYMSKYQITQGQWQAVMGNDRLNVVNTSSTNYGRGLNYPMYYVSWYDAIVYCNRLSISEGLSPAYRMERNVADGIKSTNPADWGTVPTSSNARWNAVEIVPNSNGYRLPTEAQWEYACRAETTTVWNYGNKENDDYMWYSGNNGTNGDSMYGSKAVGTKLPNAWELYDMHGNLWEWCWDWYSMYDTTPEWLTNPLGASSGSFRVLRGGSWFDSASSTRSAYRGVNAPYLLVPNIGFRLIRP